MLVVYTPSKNVGAVCYSGSIEPIVTDSNTVPMAQSKSVASLRFAISDGSFSSSFPLVSTISFFHRLCLLGSISKCFWKRLQGKTTRSPPCLVGRAEAIRTPKSSDPRVSSNADYAIPPTCALLLPDFHESLLYSQRAQTSRSFQETLLPKDHAYSQFPKRCWCVVLQNTASL